jgi:hypothetical protein
LMVRETLPDCGAAGAVCPVIAVAAKHRNAKTASFLINAS